MRRTSDGRAFVGRRQFETCRDGRRRRGGLATGKPRTYDGRITGGTRTHNGLLTDSDTDWKRTLDGLLTDFTRTSDGRAAVAGRPPYHGLLTDCTRAIHGHRPFAGRLSSGRVCVRQLFVLRSFVVRSRPVWRSSCVGSCGVRARRQIARRLTGGSQRRRIVEVKPKAADSPRAGNGLATDF